MNKAELQLVITMLKKVSAIIMDKGMPRTLARSCEDAINAVEQVQLRQSRKKQ